MKPETHKSTQLRPLERKIWTGLFRVSALVLICCMAAIVGFPDTVGYSWVYWAAAGSTLVCAVAAAMLKKFKSEEAAGDAAWLLSYRERGSKGQWDIDVDD